MHPVSWPASNIACLGDGTSHGCWLHVARKAPVRRRLGGAMGLHGAHADMRCLQMGTCVRIASRHGSHSARVHLITCQGMVNWWSLPQSTIAPGTFDWLQDSFMRRRKQFEPLVPNSCAQLHELQLLASACTAHCYSMHSPTQNQPSLAPPHET